MYEMSEAATAKIEVISDEQPEASETAHRRMVKIDNEDSGDTIRLHAELDVLVSDLIARMYNEFRLAHKSDDRLTCKSDGVDVFQYASFTLERYLHEGRCPDLFWVFVGGTGGA